MIKSNLLKKHKAYNHSIFFFNFLFATWLSWGVSGTLPRLHDILLIWCIINCLWLKPIIFKIISPLLLVLILYNPIGFQYGYPNAGMIASVLETNINETQEFFDLTLVIYTIIIIILSIITYRLTKNIKNTKKQYQFFKYFSWILITLFLVNIFSIKHKTLKLDYSKILNIIPHTMEQYQTYKISQQKILNLKNQKDNWNITSFKPKYKTYVLVIGESVSKNFLSAYGYPVQTSPFLNTAFGVKYTQAIAPAAYTIQSIPRFLTIPNKNEIEFKNNILTLANKLGMHTYWLSNQEKLGIYDNEIAYIATEAKEQYYLSEAQPNSLRYDYQLLPKTKEIIHQPINQPKLIIIHLMGSHARFSKRVDNTKSHFSFNDKYLSDYLSSILQTDMLLQEIHQELKQSNQSFSMIYLTDHGLTPQKLKHGTTQFSLQIPLFKLSSDDKSQHIDDHIVSGFGFVWFLTDWLGIQTHNQQQNTFLNHYHLNNLADVQVYDDGIKPYLTLEEFDGVLLQPHKNETKNSR